MKILFTTVKVLIIALLIAVIYFFRYAAEPAVIIDDETGIITFGFDRNQNRWLINEYPRNELGIDGPHIFYKPDGGAEILYVRGNRDSVKLTREPFLSQRRDSIWCMVDNADLNLFSFRLKDSLAINSSEYAEPRKVLAISDIEGNCQAFVRLLVSNGVVDKNLNWTYGDGHLVLLGDFMDRGINVTQCLWLIYKLEDQAKVVGGHVHFILGNHEQLNLQGIVKYAEPKYRELRRQLNIPYAALYGVNTELGRWLRTKNVMEKIGNTLFVHGGVSKDLAAGQYTIEDINNRARSAIDKKKEQIGDSLTRVILGQEGVLWYRGLVQSHRDYQKMGSSGLDSVLNAFGASRIVIGHTIVENVSSDYNGRVVRIDIKHSEVEPKALLIQDGLWFRTDATGLRERL